MIGDETFLRKFFKKADRLDKKRRGRDGIVTFDSAVEYFTEAYQENPEMFIIEDVESEVPPEKCLLE